MATLFEDDLDRQDESLRQGSEAGAPGWLVIALCLLVLGLNGIQKPRLRPYTSDRVVPPWEEADRLAWERATEAERQEALRSRE
jgi:hypothetical protein